MSSLGLPLQFSAIGNMNKFPVFTSLPFGLLLALRLFCALLRAFASPSLWVHPGALPATAWLKANFKGKIVVIWAWIVFVHIAAKKERHIMLLKKERHIMLLKKERRGWSQSCNLPLVLLEAVNEENHSPERDGACGREGGWPSDAHE
jgi:hypothetical protein